MAIAEGRFSRWWVTLPSRFGGCRTASSGVRSSGGGWDGQLAYARWDRDRVRRYPCRGRQASRVRGAVHGGGGRGLERNSLERDPFRIGIRGALWRKG